MTCTELVSVVASKPQPRFRLSASSSDSQAPPQRSPATEPERWPGGDRHSDRPGVGPVTAAPAAPHPATVLYYRDSDPSTEVVSLVTAACQWSLARHGPGRGGRGGRGGGRRPALGTRTPGTAL